MSERYTRLFSLPENLYVVAAPVVIAAGALLKDNETGNVLVQLKIRNINDRTIKAVKVKFHLFDTSGKPLNEKVEYQYLDLNEVRDSQFGQKIPIILPTDTARAFQVTVNEIVFSDNSIWAASSDSWESLTAPMTLYNGLNDSELVEQYKLKYGTDCEYMPNEQKGLWLCSCGVLNHTNEKTCHACKKELVTLKAVDFDVLKAERDTRLEEEKRLTIEKKAKTLKKKKKRVIIAASVVAAIAVAATLFACFNHYKYRVFLYNLAEEQLDAGRYVAALARFERLDRFRDSKEQIEQIRQMLYPEYMACIAKLETGEEDTADAFKAIGGMKFIDDRMTKVTGARLTSAIKGLWFTYEFNYSDYSDHYSFRDSEKFFDPNGRYASYGRTCDGTWSIGDDLIYVRTESQSAENGYRDYIYELRQLSDNVYMLVDITSSNPTVACLMIKQSE